MSCASGVTQGGTYICCDERLANHIKSRTQQWRIYKTKSVANDLGIYLTGLGLGRWVCNLCCLSIYTTVTTFTS